MGFPNVRGMRVFREASGTVLRGGQFQYHGREFLGNVTDMVTGPGWSGGPLFDAKGKVVGLLNSGDAKTTVFISFAATRRAYDTVVPKRFERQPILYVFTTPGCDGCEAFKRDYSQNAAFREKLNRHYRVQFVDVTERPDLARKYQVHSLPAFIVAAETAFKIIEIGYRGIQAILTLLVGNHDGVEEVSAPISPGPTVAPDDDHGPSGQIDWSHVSIILLAAEQDVGRVRGAVRSKLLGLATGPIERQVAEKTDGKAALSIVAQRTRPARFSAITQAAGIEVETFYVVVLVAKQPLGLKALIAGRVERIAADKLKGAPVDLIFERAHRKAYAAVVQALATEESVPSEEPEPSHPLPESPARFPFQQTALGGIVAALTERLKLLRKLRDWRTAT